MNRNANTEQISWPLSSKLHDRLRTNIEHQANILQFPVKLRRVVFLSLTASHKMSISSFQFDINSAGREPLTRASVSMVSASDALLVPKTWMLKAAIVTGSCKGIEPIFKQLIDQSVISNPRTPDQSLDNPFGAVLKRKLQSSSCPEMMLRASEEFSAATIFLLSVFVERIVLCITTCDPFLLSTQSGYHPRTRDDGGTLLFQNHANVFPDSHTDVTKTRFGQRNIQSVKRQRNGTTLNFTFINNNQPSRQLSESITASCFAAVWLTPRLIFLPSEMDRIQSTRLIPKLLFAVRGHLRVQRVYSRKTWRQMVCVGTQECQHDGRHSEKEFWDQPRTYAIWLRPPPQMIDHLPLLKLRWWHTQQNTTNTRSSYLSVAQYRTEYGNSCGLLCSALKIHSWKQM